MAAHGEEPAAAVIFLDAELYIERVGAPEVIQQLQEARSIPAVVTVFVSNQGTAARHRDYVCDPAYARFIAEDVVGWVRNRHAGVREVVLAGLSLSGLAVAYVATCYPARFRAAICQSPSFWWESARFARELPAAQVPTPEFWVCVGSRETEAGVSHAPSGLFQGLTQIEGCERACAAFRERGYPLHDRQYDGGHDPLCWRDDLALALPWVWRVR